MRLHITLTALFSVALMSASVAHALWIETDLNAIMGKPHPVKIFYGEYAAKEFETIGKWYSDVDTFALWLIAPDGEKTQLNYASADNHYVASFTPDQQGMYVLLVGHTAKAVNRGYVYQFNASAEVTVGKSAGTLQPTTEINDLYLQIVKGSKGKATVVKAYYKGKPASEIAVTVSGPTGWSKSFKTNKDGVFTFEPLWKGTYAIEGFYTSDETGIHNEKNYDHIWRCATTRVELPM